MYNVKDFEQVKKNCRSFWNHEFIGRPYICLNAPKKGMERTQKNLIMEYVTRVQNAQKGDFVSAVKEFDEYAKATAHYGESLPQYRVDLCPDQYAAFYGAEIVAREGEETSWVHNIAEELSDIDVTFDRNNPTILTLEKAFQTAAEIANGNFMLDVPDYHSNLDALSALLSPQNLCYELMDNPELLEEKLTTINNDYHKVYEIFYHAGKMDEMGTIGWHPIYCDGRTAALQCDFSCMISPADARKYVIPSLEKEAEHLDRVVYHYDGKQALGHLDDVLAIQKIDCIQWVPGAGEKRTVYWMDLLKKIQASGKSVWIYDWTKEEILADTELDPKLTVFSLSLDSQDDAEDLMEKLEKKYR